MDALLADLTSELTILIRQYPWALVAISGLGPLLLGILLKRLAREATPVAGEIPVEEAVSPPMPPTPLPQTNAALVSRAEPTSESVLPRESVFAKILAPAQKRGLRERLLRTSEVLVGRLSGVLGGRRVDEALLAELEEILFTADLGVATVESLLDQVRAEPGCGRRCGPHALEAGHG